LEHLKNQSFAEASEEVPTESPNVEVPASVEEEEEEQEQELAEDIEDEEDEYDKGCYSPRLIPYEEIDEVAVYNFTFYITIALCVLFIG
jgi:hypothetical protein